jgi:hypothetical protein
VTETAIAPEVHETFVRRLKLSSKITLDLLATLDDLTDLINLLLCEVIGADLFRYPCLT